MTGITQQMIGVGFIVSTWVGYGSSKVPSTNSFSWRFPLAFQCAPCLLLITGILFFPESPRYLVETDRADEALRVLRKLHYNGSNDDWVQAEFNEIKLTVEAERAISVPGWRIMFTVPAWRTRLMHATLVQLFGQMTGYILFPTTLSLLALTLFQVSMLLATTPPFCTTTSASLATRISSSRLSTTSSAPSATFSSSCLCSTALGVRSLSSLAQSASLLLSSARLSSGRKSKALQDRAGIRCLALVYSSCFSSHASSAYRLAPSPGSTRLRSCR